MTVLSNFESGFCLLLELLGTLHRGPFDWAVPLLGAAAALVGAAVFADWRTAAQVAMPEFPRWGRTWCKLVTLA